MIFKMTIDTYMLDIAEKDESSALLAELALPTLNREFVHQVVPGKNGLSFLKVPEDYVLVGHSSGGDYGIRDAARYSASIVNHLIRDDRIVGAEPLAVASVIDAQSTDLEFVRAAGTAFNEICLEKKVANINGELAKYGAMVNCPCNISATMLGLLRRDSECAKRYLGRVFESQGVRYLVFDPKGKFVWMNSDGTGTKPLINGRFGREEGSVDDVIAMLFDDKGKYGGGAYAAFCLVESRGGSVLLFDAINQYATGRASKMGAWAVMQQERVGDRLVGPHGEKVVYNISGNLVSLVDESMINNMPRPKEGNSLIAIKGDGRSNGFTDRRNLVAEWLGNNWHETDGGKYFGEFLCKPSIVFYPIFSDLIDKRLASSVYHMSGGAFRDKLSKPIAKHGLYVEIGVEEGSPQLFKPDPREAAFAANFNIKNAYAKYAMGNEGFIATDKPEEVLTYLKSKGLEARVVGKLFTKQDTISRSVTGVKLRAFNGDIVDFTREAA